MTSDRNKHLKRDGIIGLGLIIFSTIKDDYNHTFKAAVLITVVNALYSLRNLFDIIPIWLYLLVVGIGLVSFVTIRDKRK